jgi:hypothetical protein
MWHVSGVERRCDGPRSATLGTRRTGKGAFESMEAVMSVVGRVVALWRYPVKSMAGEELDGAEVSWHGLGG